MADAAVRRRAYGRAMLTTRREPPQTSPPRTQKAHALTAGEREWIRRQGRAARTLEARQRRALRERRSERP